MSKLVLYLLGIALLAVGLSWLADRPGNLVVTWQGYDIETTVFRAVVLLAFLLALAVFAWSLFRQIWRSPATVGQFFQRRRQERGIDALASGMIALSAGDRLLAGRYAQQAKKTMPNSPLTQLLRAQVAQLSGDRATSRRIFEAMLAAPDTEQLGLRGLYEEAEREGAAEAARQFAERALRLNPKLPWPVEALFDLQCKAGDWEAALETLASGRKHGHVEKHLGDRRRAVLLTAQAQALQEDNPAKAIELANEAAGLAPDLIAAAAIAGRLHAARGNTARVAKIVERTWKCAPHPDLAVAYAYARTGDSPRDRLERIKRLARTTPHSAEGPIAVATAAIEAREWDEARAALTPLLEERLSQRVCKLMARIEGGEKGDSGRVREWLARAAHAPRDPVWTADGVIAEEWAPISPVTGHLDAFQWKVPATTAAEGADQPTLAELDQRVLLAAGRSDADLIAAASEAAVSAPEPEVTPEPAPVAAAAPKPRPRPAEEPVTAEVEPVTAPVRKPALRPADFIADVAPAPKAAAPQPVAVTVAAAAAVEKPASGNGSHEKRTSPIALATEKAAQSPVTPKVILTRPKTGNAYVPPRAPDDPGLDGDTPIELPEAPSKAFRSKSSKSPL